MEVKWIKQEEGEGPLCDEATLQRLQEEASQLLKNISQMETSVGDAMIIEYDADFAAKQKIGRFGRLTIKGGVRQYHAAPEKIERTERFSYGERDFFQYAHQWEEGSVARPPVEKLLEEPELPKMIKPPPRSQVSYEIALFDRISQMGDITVVNPSMSTLVALKNAGGGYVTLTSSVREAWVYNIRDFVRNSDDLLEMLPNMTVQGTAYLGTSTPLWYPNTPWIRMVINPFVDQTNYYEEFSVDMRETEVRMVIKKKHNYYSHTFLVRDENCVRYNPETLDHFLSKNGKQFWLETTSSLTIPDREEQKIAHVPWFVDYDGEWTEIEGRKWLVKNKTVYDVKDRGTYVTRRRLPPPEGYSWTEYKGVAPYIVFYNSLRPRKEVGLDVETWESKKGFSGVAKFSGVRLTSRVYKIKSGEGIFFNKSQGQLLPGPDLIYMSPTREKDMLSHVYVDEQGRYYNPRSVLGEGVLLQLGGQKYRLPFAPGEVHRVTVMQGWEYAVMIMPRDLVPGHYLAFPNDKSFNDNLDTLSLFSTKMRVVESLVMRKSDPEYGGMTTEITELQRIEMVMKQVTVKEPQDNALTAAKVIELVPGRTQGNMYNFLSRRPDIWIWKQGTRVATQFIREDMIETKFSGVVQEGFFDGTEWRKALPRIRSVTAFQRFKLPISLHVSTGDFERFLRANGYKVRRRETLLVADLEISKY